VVVRKASLESAVDEDPRGGHPWPAAGHGEVPAWTGVTFLGSCAERAEGGQVLQEPKRRIFQPL
jgi:hypothetical protein